MGLKIVLFGTGEFALPVFKRLICSETHEVVGVYTQPDRTGRGHHRHVNQVKELGQNHGIPVFQPLKVNSDEALNELRQLDADIFVVAAYGQILKQEFLDIAPMGAFNLHGSLLPRHRGAAPVQYSIWKGDREGGVTMFQIERGLDSGPMIANVATDIGPKETSGDLMTRLAELSVDLTVTALEELEAGRAQFVTQDESQVTLAPRIPKTAGVIDWNQSAEEIDCHVRAMQPWPKASSELTCRDRKPLRCILIDVDPVSEETGRQPGSIQSTRGQVLVQTGKGCLKLNTIQPAGKQAMNAASFVNGYNLSDDASFGLAETA